MPTESPALARYPSPRHGKLEAKHLLMRDGVHVVQPRQFLNIDREYCSKIHPLEWIKHWQCNPFLSPPSTSTRTKAAAATARPTSTTTSSPIAATTRQPANDPAPPAGTQTSPVAPAPPATTSDQPNSQAPGVPTISTTPSQSNTESDAQITSSPQGNDEAPTDANASSFVVTTIVTTHAKGNQAGEVEIETFTRTLNFIKSIDGSNTEPTVSPPANNDTAGPGAVGAKSDSPNTGAIVGGILGALALLLLLVFAFVLVRRRMRRSRVPPSAEFMQRYGNSRALHSPNQGYTSPSPGSPDMEEIPQYTQGSYQLPFREKW